MKKNQNSKLFYQLCDIVSDAIANGDDRISLHIEDAKKIESLLKSDPRLLIIVEGGLIQSMISDRLMKVMILDCDIEGLDKTKKYKDYDGTEFEAIEAYDNVTINKKIVRHFFNQKKIKV